MHGRSTDLNTYTAEPLIIHTHLIRQGWSYEELAISNTIRLEKYPPKLWTWFSKSGCGL
jgi:hypothetical protein